jgi:hypothetical protein
LPLINLIDSANDSPLDEQTAKRFHPPPIHPKVASAEARGRPNRDQVLTNAQMQL